jgi:nucleotide-binding universal stress UspA family protein
MNPHPQTDLERVLRVSLAREMSDNHEGKPAVSTGDSAIGGHPISESSPQKKPEASASSSIVCATDFSEASTQAFEISALLAQRLGEPLALVHAVDDESRDSLPGEIRDSLALYARAQYHEQCERLRELNVPIIEGFRAGRPDSVLLEQAADEHARLLVMASTRKRRLSRWMHGSVAERVAEAAKCPTLIVRDAAPLLRWLKGERRLRVLLAADLSAASAPALQWVKWIRPLGPCEVFVSYFEPQPLALSPIGYPSALVDDLVADATHRQERFFRQTIRSVLGRNVYISFEKGWAFSDAHLIQRAMEVRAELIVVGTHSRHGCSRFGHHSVSRGVIHYASTNVVCVPGVDPARRKQPFAINQTTIEPSSHEN